MRAYLVFSFLICSAFALPKNVDHSLEVRQRSELDVFANTRKLIEQLVQNLRNAATEALEAISVFETGLLEQAKLIREKIVNDILSLRDRVSQAIKGVVDKITGSGAAVRQCIESHRSDANVLFNDTMTKTLECADERISEIDLQIEHLKNNSNSAIEFSSNALNEMKKCVEENTGSIWSVGACLGTVALKTEMKAAVFTAQSALAIARLNLGLATMPAALEVCAGSNVVAAGIVTAKIVMEIGSCSASSVVTNLSSNNL